MVSGICYPGLCRFTPTGINVPLELAHGLVVVFLKYHVDLDHSKPTTSYVGGELLLPAAHQWTGILIAAGAPELEEVAHDELVMHLIHSKNPKGAQVWQLAAH